MRRMLCVWFPLWPIQRLRHAQPELKEIPLILNAPGRGGPKVVVCSPQARKEGIKPGMPVAEARAILGMHSRTHFERLNAEADRKTLRRLALWCQCFTPLTAVERPDSLFLDIAGCGPLFKGEQNLARCVMRQLKSLAYSTRRRRRHRRCRLGFCSSS